MSQVISQADMTTPALSILIPTLPSRTAQLCALVEDLEAQRRKLTHPVAVEILWLGDRICVDRQHTCFDRTSLRYIHVRFYGVDTRCGRLQTHCGCDRARTSTSKRNLDTRRTADRRIATAIRRLLPLDLSQGSRRIVGNLVIVLGQCRRRQTEVRDLSRFSVGRHMSLCQSLSQSQWPSLSQYPRRRGSGLRGSLSFQSRPSPRRP